MKKNNFNLYQKYKYENYVLTYIGKSIGAYSSYACFLAIDEDNQDEDLDFVLIEDLISIDFDVNNLIEELNLEILEDEDLCDKPWINAELFYFNLDSSKYKEIKLLTQDKIKNIIER